MVLLSLANLLPISKVASRAVLLNPVSLLLISKVVNRAVSPVNPPLKVSSREALLLMIRPKKMLKRQSMKQVKRSKMLLISRIRMNKLVKALKIRWIS